MVWCAMAVHENSATARALPAVPIALAVSGSRATSLTVSARARSKTCGSYEPARHTVDDHLGNSADIGCDHGGVGGHGLEVDDPERFVHRRAYEHSCCRQNLANLFGRQHVSNPEHTGTLPSQFGDRALRFRSDLRCVRRARAEDQLNRRIEVMGRRDQVAHALLPGDASDERDHRSARIDADLCQRGIRRIGRRAGVPFRGVDSVAHHVNSTWIEARICVQDILRHAFAHRDDGVCVFDGVLLRP